ncbi:MAG: glycosyltransferase family 4 protein [Phycisphaeraceae bacterium]|nr:glycosyltransferase family 4 protein [Phycisphaeraceae bacterium]
MHVALLANTAWLDEELRMFRHLVVGLIDEQVRVAQVVPNLVPEHEITTFGDVVTWRDSRWPLLRSWRLTRVADELEKLGVDLIHALDGRLWGAAVRLSDRLNIPVILGATSVLDLTEADRLLRRKGRAPLAFVTTTAPLGQAIARKVHGRQTPVEVIAPGVYLPENVLRNEAGEVTCAVVSGNGEVDEDYEALFTAIRHVVDRHPDIHFFLDGQRSEQRSLWQLAQRNGLLEFVSLVPRRLGHREALLKSDVLIHPQPLGKSRSVILQAMAHGLPVLARSDPWVDYLVEDQTAWLAESADSRRWIELLERLIQHPPDARALGLRSRQWVKDKHVPSRQVAATLQMYRRVTGEAIKFPPPPGSTESPGGNEPRA